MGNIQHWFLHVDLDAFFASVEQLDHPEYRGKPVIVGGKPEDRRSVVSTASYEARKFGVHSAMPTAQAYKLCPQGIYVYGRMERYAQLSYCIMEILRNYSPDVDQMSIDEAFLDITGTEKLFGPPEITAQKIKKEIKEKTGLTVSIGLAQSKYHAKIASDINKPDGFYCVQPGTEEDFMLNLPLKKVFGVGTKTQEKLNNCGLKTTKDIHDKPLKYLQFLCGENQGQFLYDIVRGKFDDERFGKEPKSHSISAETTFAYDVNDEYTLETVIMTLAYSIMFRLLKEKGFSRTAFLKIRYEDFSTVSIQQTFDKNIMNLDSYYDILKDLFETKWEKNRGVRLIGVGLENIEKEDKTLQQELFDDGSEKKQKVEKAILQMSQKHPELKIHKARMMQNVKKGFKAILFATFFSTSLFSQKLYSQETSTDADEKKEPAFKYEITGFWETGVSGNLQTTFGNNTDFIFSWSTPVFKQSVDLTGNFSFGANWNFYINFADNFNKNTYTITYTGEKNLKKFMFSNRNIVFPKDYSSTKTGQNPGGGNNEAPGILFHWEDSKNEKFLADFVLRYDMTNAETATFYGKNKVNEISFSPNNYVKGRFFVIPDSDIITKIQNIYVETDNNSLSEVYYSKGQKFKKLDSSEYLIQAQSKILILSNSVIKNINDNPQKIIITFTDSSSITSLKNILGNYTDSSSYLGKIQEYFNQSEQKITLSNFTYNLEEQINGENGIVLQSTKGFSPFLISSAYETGNINNSDIYVINSISKQINNSFTASNTQFDLTQLQEDFFNTKNQIVTIYQKTTSSNDFELPENRYPFANIDPYIYISNQNNNKLSILKRSYTAVSNFDIGKDADGSSIILRINGIPNHNFIYSSTSGFITLNQNVSETDRIDVNWNKQAASADNGTVVSAAGFKYFLSPSLSTDVTAAIRIPFNPFVNYGTYDSNHSSYFAVTSGINYSKENLKIEDTASISIENPNITDTYIVNQINTSGNSTYYNGQTSTHETKIAPVLQNAGIILSKDKMGKNLVTKGENDSRISGYKLPVKWNFSSEENWTSIDIDLSQAELLCNSNKFEFALLNETGSDLENYKIFLQLGILCSNTKEGLEENVPTWDITSQIDFSSAFTNTWQIIQVPITEEQQASLVTQKGARLIIYRNTSTENSGKISFGPYEYYKKGISVSAGNSIDVNSTLEYSPKAPAAKNYFSSDFYSDAVSWNIIPPVPSPEEGMITLTSYFQPSSFSDYKKINFDFAIIPENTSTATANTLPGIILILDDAESSGEALRLEISQELASQFYDSEYHTISINTKTRELFIDNNKISSDKYSLLINKNIAPTRQKTIINTNCNSNVISKGKIYTGSLYYTEIDYYFNIKNIFQVNYAKQTITADKDEKPVLHNAYVNLSSNQSDSIAFDDNGTNSFYSDALLQTGVSLLKTDFSTILLVDFNNTDYFDLKNFGYNIKTNNPYFNVINFQESFDFNKQNLQIKKEDTINFNLSKIEIPVEGSFTVSETETALKYQQKYNSTFNFEVPVKDTKLASKTTFVLTQKADNSDFSENNFPSLWDSYVSSFEKQFSSGTSLAEQRTVALNQNLTYSITKNLVPQLTCSISSITANNQVQSFSNTSAFALTVPFKINKNSFSFTYSKQGTYKEENTILNNYGQDLSQMFENQQQISWVYSSIPFYELFDNTLADKMLDSNGKSNYFNTKYGFSWKRPLFSSEKDIYIPSGFSTSITRDIITSTNINDIYQIKATLNYNFVNLLGSKGKLKLFDFFTQDEYVSALTAQIKIPESASNITWNLTYNEALLMYIDTKNTIKVNSDFTISGKETWQIKFGTLWTHSGKDSLLIMLPALFYNKINEMNKEVARKENLLISFGKDNGTLKQEYKYVHSCDVSLNKNITISTSLGTGFNYTQDKALSLSLDYYLGGKISF